MDFQQKWTKSTKVGLRPEPFGALAYHFDTRRLVFLKSLALVDLVERLSDYATADEAIDQATASTATSRRSFETALDSLAEAGIIEVAA